MKTKLQKYLVPLFSITLTISSIYFREYCTSMVISNNIKDHHNSDVGTMMIKPNMILYRQK